jgi:hypothetical protein
METYKNQLYHINTPEKAYFLGFLYGDGSICQYKDGDRIRFTTKLSLHEKDEEIIKKLFNFFPFFRFGKMNYSKYNKNSGTQVYIQSSSKNLFDDLIKNGISTRKSYENKENLSLPTYISKSLMRDFIRGFFDADGSVYKIKNRKNLLNISICSNSKNFIETLNLYLREQNINSWRIRKKIPTGKGRQIYYEIAIIKSNDVENFKNLIYTDSTFYLERKKKIFDSFRIVDKVLDREINCPNCSSNHTQRNGKRGIRIRMKCGECQLNFSI